MSIVVSIDIGRYTEGQIYLARRFGGINKNR